MASYLLENLLFFMFSDWPRYSAFICLLSLLSSFNNKSYTPQYPLVKQTRCNNFRRVLEGSLWFLLEFIKIRLGGLFEFLV